MQFLVLRQYPGRVSLSTTRIDAFDYFSNLVGWARLGPSCFGLSRHSNGGLCSVSNSKLLIMWLYFFSTSQIAQILGRKYGLDHDGDGDVDGKDLATLAGDFKENCLSTFAASFGELP